MFIYYVFVSVQIYQKLWQKTLFFVHEETYYFCKIVGIMP